MFVTTPEFLPQHRQQHQQLLQIVSAPEGPRPAPRRRDEPAGPRQPRPDHHRPGGRRGRRRIGGGRCGLTTPDISSTRPATATSTPGPRRSRPCARSTPLARPSPSTPWPARPASRGPGSTPSPTCEPRSNGFGPRDDERPPTRCRPGSGPPMPRSFDGWKPPTNATAGSPREPSAPEATGPRARRAPRRPMAEPARPRAPLTDASLAPNDHNEPHQRRASGRRCGRRWAEVDLGSRPARGGVRHAANKIPAAPITA